MPILKSGLVRKAAVFAMNSGTYYLVMSLSWYLGRRFLLCMSNIARPRDQNYDLMTILLALAVVHFIVSLVFRAGILFLKIISGLRALEMTGKSLHYGPLRLRGSITSGLFVLTLWVSLI